MGGVGGSELIDPFLGMKSNSFQMEHLHCHPQPLAVGGGGRLPLKMPTLGSRC